MRLTGSGSEAAAKCGNDKSGRVARGALVPDVLKAPTTEMMKLLISVAEVEARLSSAPTVFYLSQATQLNVAEVLRSTPRIGTWSIGSPSYGAFHVEHSGVVDDRSTVGLTLLGVFHLRHEVPGYDALIERFLECVRMMAEKFRVFLPDPVAIEYPQLSSDELTEFYRLASVAEPKMVTSRVRRLMKRELWLALGSSSGDESQWFQDIQGGIRSYQGVGGFSDYLSRKAFAIDSVIAMKQGDSKVVRADTDDPDEIQLVVQHSFDVALSFSGAQRVFVSEVAGHLKTLGVKVFFDEFGKSGLWGANLVEEFQEIYEHRSRYVVIFVSVEYLESKWTSLERRSAIDGAMTRNQQRVLPVRFDDVALPGLSSSVGYLSASEYSTAALASLIAKKVSESF